MLRYMFTFEVNLLQNIQKMNSRKMKSFSLSLNHEFNEKWKLIFEQIADELVDFHI